ncbi:hypothetical protein A8F72_06740 [Burkholderia cenocepacia]|nr:hypothetical protein A8F32_16980 [Burkholderia cenocepacia]ONI97753.1 hypothetical protein A8F33_37045 [Burkholderia cenocepacia]ONJ02279.1 hypothetical protein A8F53_20270 [Burkholderia cenocepacia]ONJ34609.1 hypothetical protein A8F38_11275 [Burkholderia cenocepacia]ONY69146.1 hypothetical protein A8F35_23125 [Burkholderia cenocepacia]
MSSSSRRHGCGIEHTRSSTRGQRKSFERLTVFVVPAISLRAARGTPLDLPATRHRRVTSRT